MNDALRRRISWPAIGLSMLAACAAKRPATTADVQAPAAASDARVEQLLQARTSGAVRTEPCLGPGDLVEISVFRWADMQNYRTRVSPAGNVSLPLLGSMQAAGLTETELRDRIRDGLKREVLRDPQVNVFVAEYVSQQVSVTGAVARPGLYGLTRDRRTVSDLISEAGGMNEHAGGRVQLYPSPGGSCDGAAGRPGLRGRPDVEPVEFEVNDEYAHAGDNPLSLPVVGGDAIVVNRGRFLVNGWVQTPGAYDIAPGMTALGAISAAGGAVYAGDMSRVSVWRTRRGGTKEKIDVNMKAVAEGQEKDVTLQGGDIVNVPASAVKMVPYSAYWILTTVVRVGASVPIF
jgi:polysaccharide export outer membrane protein